MPSPDAWRRAAARSQARANLRRAAARAEEERRLLPRRAREIGDLIVVVALIIAGGYALLALAVSFADHW